MFSYLSYLTSVLTNLSEPTGKQKKNSKLIDKIKHDLQLALAYACMRFSVKNLNSTFTTVLLLLQKGSEPP